MTRRYVRKLAHVALAALLGGAALSAAAQATKSASEYPDSRVDIYAGYGWFHPLNSGINHYQYQDVTNPNATAAVSYFFNHYVGVQMEGGYFSGNGEHEIYQQNPPYCFRANCDQIVYTAEAGPILRYPLGAFVPYIHMLGGGERTNGPVAQNLTWGWGVTGGIGFDYILPFFHKHFALRGQGDWQYSQVVYGPLVLPAGITGGFGEIDAIKVSGGVVFRVGSQKEREPLMLGCTTNPISVLPGDPVEVTASTMNLDPRRPARYDWQVNGGRITPHGETATVDTTGLVPGEYTIGGHVSQGVKAKQQASCTVPFSVLQVVKTQPQAAATPLALSCTASPSSATSGTTIDIAATATSASNRPLSYSYAASAGTVVTDGPTAKLATAGLGATTITVTCNVTDDLGERASAIATVRIENPVVPVIPQTQSLCSIGFMRDTKRPVRVDNEAKACLDDIALTMSQQADARLVMIGNSSPDEKDSAAAERTLNARQYLTQEKAVDPSRIEVRVGETSGRTVNNVLVPTGATFLDTNTQTFDETQIVRHGQAYGVHRGSALTGVSTPGVRHTTRHRTAPRKPRTTAELPYSTTPAPAPAPATSGTPVTTIPPLQ